MTQIALVGFGEAAQAIARGLAREPAVTRVTAYDIRFADPAASGELMARARERKVTPAPDLAEALAGADISLSLVVGSAAVRVGEAAGAHLKAGQIFVDLNSIGPDAKKRVAQALAKGGNAAFVEGAVMARVPPLEHKVPILLAGAEAERAAALLSAAGMDIEAVGTEVGQACAVKIIRSIIVKGVEALLIESLTAAEKAGVRERIIDSISQTFPGLDWRQTATYYIGRTQQHGARRVTEMSEAAATLESLGLQPILSTAIAQTIGAAHAKLAEAALPIDRPYAELLAVLAADPGTKVAAGMRPEVTVRVQFPSAGLRLLEQDFDVHYAPTPEAFEQAIVGFPQTRGLVTNGSFGVTGDQLRRMRALEIVLTQGPGHENVDLDAVKALKLVLTTGKGTNAFSVADHAMALLLAVARDIVRADQRVRSGLWLKSREPRAIAWKKRIGILGLGEIGLQIAERAQGFGMTVGYHNRNRREDVRFDYKADPVSLAADSDFLVVAMPGGPGTRGLVGRDVLDALGPTGFLVNVGRGSIVDTAELVSALSNGRIAGAALDVVAGEPEVSTNSGSAAPHPHAAHRITLAGIGVRGDAAHIGEPVGAFLRGRTGFQGRLTSGRPPSDRREDRPRGAQARRVAAATEKFHGAGAGGALRGGGRRIDEEHSRRRGLSCRGVQLPRRYSGTARVSVTRLTSVAVSISLMRRTIQPVSGLAL